MAHVLHGMSQNLEYKILRHTPDSNSALTLDKFITSVKMTANIPI